MLKLLRQNPLDHFKFHLSVEYAQPLAIQTFMMRFLLLLVVVNIMLVGCSKRGEIKPPKGGPRRKVSLDQEMETEAIRAMLTIEHIKQAHGEDCRIRAKAGSHVSVEHRGYIHSVAEPKDARLVGKQFDSNIEGETLNFTLRSKHVIRGLDYAIEGLCIGDRIEVVIPPQLAFDDPALLFAWDEEDGRPRPAPPGTSVKYEVHVVDIRRDPATMSGLMWGLVSIGLMVVAIGMAWLVAWSLDTEGRGKGSKLKEQKKAR